MAMWFAECLCFDIPSRQAFSLSLLSLACPCLQVLAFLVNGVKTPDPTTLANVATALCRCTYEARNHKRLVTEFNTAQALCYIMQRQTVNVKIVSAKGMLNMCGLSPNMPALVAKLDVYMLTLCSAMEELARNEKETVQVGSGALQSYNYAITGLASLQP